LILGKTNNTKVSDFRWVKVTRRLVKPPGHWLVGPVPEFVIHRDWDGRGAPR
jgi:hypothetical protein